MQTKFELDTPTRHKGIKCGFSFLKIFSFCCAVTTTNDPSKAIFTVNIMIWEREKRGLISYLSVEVVIDVFTLKYCPAGKMR